ncbi:hypothetical protein DFJ73DRAFT_792311, partial [Zopfochytrium polystomum]
WSTTTPPPQSPPWSPRPRCSLPPRTTPPLPTCRSPRPPPSPRPRRRRRECRPRRPPRQPRRRACSGSLTASRTAQPAACRQGLLLWASACLGLFWCFLFVRRIRFRLLSLAAATRFFLRLCPASRQILPLSGR